MAIDIPAPYAGFVHLLAKRGETFPVETLLAKIAESKEEYHALMTGADSVAASGAPKPPTAVLVSGEPERPLASGSEGQPRRIRASGLAKAIARKNGIALSQISGSGPGGRIVRQDVIAALGAVQPQAETPSRAMASTSGEMREKARIPLAGMRATIAQRMVASKTTAAHTYIFFEIDVTKLLAARKTILGYENQLGSRVSLIAFYARAMALACQHAPICNSTLANNQITLWENVNVGIVVALPGRTEYDSGLIVPVVRDTQSKGVLQIDTEIRDLVKRARTSELSQAELSDGTITISSTDGFYPGGWFVSTPLLNLPQVVNFQPGTPIEKPVVIDGQIAIRTLLPCGMSFDHRAVDGEPVARFARKLRDVLTDPELMLL